MTFISYAQNLEDVMLWRALKSFTPGRYVDIGAQDPVVDSVSKAFHDAGWYGVHVEPSPSFAAALRQAFPKDNVIEAAVAAKPGKIPFYEVPGSGLSTARADIAQFHRDHAGHDPIERQVAAITLKQILNKLDDKPIHWMKVDVEGLEREVLEGWGDSRQRPWIIVIESTFPTTSEPMYEEWENLVTAKGYDLVYTDQLNRFYLHRDQKALRASFRYPPNVFDDFELSGTATALTAGLMRRLNAELEERSSRIGALETAVKQVSVERDALKSAVVDQQIQRQLDQNGVATELQRLRMVERRAGEAERVNLRIWEEKTAAETKADALEAKLAAAVESLSTAELDRVRLRSSVGEAERANLRLGEEKAAAETKADALDAKLAEVVQSLKAVELDRDRLRSSVGEAERANLRLGEEKAAAETKADALDAKLAEVVQSLAAVELDRDRLRSSVGEAERVNLRLGEEKTAAETKADALDAKLAVVLQSLAAVEADRDRLHQRATDVATANLGLIATLESRENEADQLVDELDIQRELVANWQAKHEAQFQTLVDVGYALRNSEELVEALREEASLLSRELESRTEYVTCLREALDGALRENEDMAARLSRVAGTFWVRLLMTVGLVHIETRGHNSQFAHASQLLEASLPSSSDTHERQVQHEDKRLMAEIIPAHVDHLIMANGSAFVDQLYRAVLRRSPDRAGREHYIDRLRAGDGKEAVLLAVADSPEARGLPNQLAGLDEFRARNAPNPKDRKGDIRRLERSMNRIEFSFGEMQARAEARIDNILDRLSSIEASFLRLTSGPAYDVGGRFAVDPDDAAAAPIRRPLRDTVGDVTASEPSQFIKELSEAVRQSSEAATFANLAR